MTALLLVHCTMNPSHVLSHGTTEMKMPNKSHLVIGAMNPGRVARQAAAPCLAIHGMAEIEIPNESLLLVDGVMNPGNVVSHALVEMQIPNDIILLVHGVRSLGCVIHPWFQCNANN